MPRKNAEVLRKKMANINNDNIKLINENKFIINNRVTLEIVTSCTTRQLVDSIVVESYLKEDKKLYVDRVIPKESIDQQQKFVDDYQK